MHPAPRSPAPPGLQAVLTTSQHGLGDFQGWGLCSQNFHGKGSKVIYFICERSKPSFAEFLSVCECSPACLPSSTEAHTSRDTLTSCPLWRATGSAPGPSPPALSSRHQPLRTLSPASPGYLLAPDPKSTCPLRKATIPEFS